MIPTLCRMTDSPSPLTDRERWLVGAAQTLVQTMQGLGDCGELSPALLVDALATDGLMLRLQNGEEVRRGSLTRILLELED